MNASADIARLPLNIINPTLKSVRLDLAVFIFITNSSSEKFITNPLIIGIINLNTPIAGAANVSIGAANIIDLAKSKIPLPNPEIIATAPSASFLLTLSLIPSIMADIILPVCLPIMGANGSDTFRYSMLLLILLANSLKSIDDIFLSTSNFSSNSFLSAIFAIPLFIPDIIEPILEPILFVNGCIIFRYGIDFAVFLLNS